MSIATQVWCQLKWCIMSVYLIHSKCADESNSWPSSSSCSHPPRKLDGARSCSIQLSGWNEHCCTTFMSCQMVHHDHISYSQQMCWCIKLMIDEHCHPESWTEQGLAPSSSLGGMSTAEPPISYPQQWWRWWWAMSFHNRFWTLADLAISRNDCGTTWLSSSPNSLWNKSQANRLGCWLLLMKKGCIVFS